MSLVEELLAASGGITTEGALRSPRELWSLLEGAPSTTILDATRRSPAALLRLMPEGAGALLLDLADDSYWLLSPCELAALFGHDDPDSSGPDVLE